jgi:hypothetical protein
MNTYPLAVKKLPNHPGKGDRGHGEDVQQEQQKVLCVARPNTVVHCGNDMATSVKASSQTTGGQERQK